MFGVEISCLITAADRLSSRAGSVSIFLVRFDSVRFSVSSSRFRFSYSTTMKSLQTVGCDTPNEPVFCNILKNKRKQMLPAFTSLTINVHFSLLHETNHATF